MKMSREELVKSLLLYAVTDSQWLKAGESLTEKVEEAIEGGAGFVQLREKEMSDVEMESLALGIKQVCGRHKVPFVLDDNVMLAKKIDCDGVHVGQEDMAADRVRDFIGPDKILGVSAKTVEQALLAERMGADYLGVGAVFSTGTKPTAKSCSLDMVKAICEAVSIPCIAIGGINGENVSLLSGRGLVGVAVVSAIFANADVKGSTGKLLGKVRAALQ